MIKFIQEPYDRGRAGGKHGEIMLMHPLWQRQYRRFDVTITWKIEAAGKIDADIAAMEKMMNFPDCQDLV